MYRIAVVRLAVIAAATAAAVAARSLHAQEPGGAPARVPAAWDTSYVVLLEANPDYRPASPEAMQSAIGAHMRYQLGLIEHGRTIRGGPLATAPGASLVGITVLRASSADEARAIAHADPGVQAGLLRATVRTWTTPAAAAIPEADPRDVSTIEGIMHAFYDVINGPPGQPRQWERDKTLYMPGARFVSFAVRDGQPIVRRMTPEEYRLRNDSSYVANGVFETEVASRIERFGNMAQVRSIGAYRTSPDGPVLARSVNYVQLYWDGERWWIASAMWDEERAGSEIPAEWVRER